jgi:tetratricopeptide (TPR) repeat protein
MLDEDVYLAMCDIFVEAGLEMEAETILRGAVQTFPASRLLRYELAERLAASEHPAAALDVFEIAARIAAPAAQDSIADMRERSSIYRRIGDMHMALTQFDEAASAFRAALEIDPSNVAARLGLGRLYSQEIMFDEAASAFRTALEIDSSNVAARLGLGRLYSQENMFDEALTEYAAVILEHPENVDAYMGRAEVHERVGRFLEAAEEAGRALAIEPDHQTAHYLLGRALIRVGRTAEGQDHLKEYQRLEAEANARLSMRREVVSARGEAAEHLIDGRYEEAIAVLNKAIDENPDAVPFYVTIGLAESARGRHGEAVATFQRIVALGAGDFLVHYNLAEIYQLMGRIEASRRHRTIYLQQINDELQMRSGRIESSWTIATSAR